MSSKQCWLHFGESDDGKEIVSDIEARMAEIFSEKSKGQKNVVTLELVKEVIKTMGTPESFTEEMGNEELFTGQISRKKRLYRDTQETVLGGVCGGLAAFFNIDPVVVRIIFVILTFITTGVGVLVYLILWIAVPKALNTAQRLEMRGQEVSVKNIENFLKNESNTVNESYNKFRKSNFFSRNEKS